MGMVLAISGSSNNKRRRCSAHSSLAFSVHTNNVTNAQLDLESISSGAITHICSFLDVTAISAVLRVSKMVCCAAKNALQRKSHDSFVGTDAVAVKTYLRFLKLYKLKIISLSIQAPFGVEDLKQLLPNFYNIQHLVLKHNNVVNENGLFSILSEQLTALTTISLRGIYAEASETMGLLQNSQAMRKISLHCLAQAGNALRLLIYTESLPLSSIHTLHLRCCGLYDEHCAILVRYFPNLIDLSLASNVISDQGVLRIGSLRSLTTLDLMFTSMTIEGFISFACNPKLFVSLESIVTDLIDEDILRQIRPNLKLSRATGQFQPPSATTTTTQPTSLSTQTTAHQSQTTGITFSNTSDVTIPTANTAIPPKAMGRTTNSCSNSECSGDTPEPTSSLLDFDLWSATFSQETENSSSLWGFDRYQEDFPNPPGSTEN